MSSVRLPAICGMMGARKYYTCQVSLGLVPTLFPKQDWSALPTELRSQRELQKKRIPEVAGYILSRPKDWVFPSITASFETEPEWEPLDRRGSVGFIEIDGGSANLLINDGQHRVAGICAALRECPELAAQSVSVLLFPHETVEQAQQMFTDINMNAAPSTKSLNTFFNHRDPVRETVMAAVQDVSVFLGRVEHVKPSPSPNSQQLVSLGALYDATKLLLGFSLKQRPQGIKAEDAKPRVSAFWREITSTIPGWRDVQAGNTTAAAFRLDNVSCHASVLRALGMIGHEVMNRYPDSWATELRPLAQINWSTRNPDWRNALRAGNQEVEAARQYLRRYLRLTETPSVAVTPAETNYNGTWLKYQREVHKLKQRDVFERLGVSNTTYSEWENNHKSIPPAHLTQILRIFNQDSAAAA